MKKILFLRNMSTEVNLNKYNLQEIGLARSLTTQGYSCTIVYYTVGKREKRLIEYNGSTIEILFEPGIKISNMVIYNNLIKEKFFDKFDLIQTSEYRQLMTVILPYITRTKCIIWNGVYENISRGYINKIFDILFLRSLRKKYKCIITKSELAKEYLVSKGFNEGIITVCGIGLDQTEINSDGSINLRIRKEDKVIGYLGKLEERRNIRFVFDILKELLKVDSNYKLLLVGDGDKKQVDAYFDYAGEIGITDNIVYHKSIDQRYLKTFYDNTDVFVLPTSYEIFGMVILECMYFGVPIITTYNGGSSVLIKEESDGLIVDELSTAKWKDSVIYLRETIGRKKTNIPNKDVTWSTIVKKYINVYEKIR